MASCKSYILSGLFFLGSVRCLLAQVQQGKASYYSDKFKGRSTASGEKYDPLKFTAAHRTLPFGTCVKITNLANDSSVFLRINDRGPFIKGRVIDVSGSAAKRLDFYLKGIAPVRVETIDSLELKVDSVQTRMAKF